VKSNIFIVLLILLCTLSVALTPITIEFGETTAIYYEEYLNLFDEIVDYEETSVERVIDGNTLLIMRHKTLNLIETVRLIGLDTPGTKYPTKAFEQFDKEASNFANTLLEDEKIILSYDSKSKDSDGSVLSYVWLPATYKGKTYNILFNLASITSGYGFASTKFPFKDYYMEIFIESERQARINSIGLWADEKFANPEPILEYDPIVYITDTGEKYHNAGCRYLRESKIAIWLSEAIMRDYKPCSVCNPPR